MERVLLVTGGAGFIGSNFVRTALSRTDNRVVVLDKLTYAGNLANLKEIASDPRFVFVRGDIADLPLLRQIFRDHRPERVVNFAAETHVDRSIDSPSDFVETNVVGTFALLEMAREFCQSLDADQRKCFRFLQISTDEVFGSLGETGQFSETTPVAPNSPYSASKASADHFVRSYFTTYGLPTLITNCSNNYGPYQFPEKLIPLMILNALEGRDLPIYGDGGNVRDWIYVEDHCAGVLEVLDHGRVGEAYNLGGRCERTNLQIVDSLCDILEGLRPAASNPHMKKRGKRSYRELKTYVADRPGHDRRYAIDCSKVERDLGWTPSHDLQVGLSRTVEWYLVNLAWCEAVQSRGYRRERLGLGSESRGIPAEAAGEEDQS